jgi:hypothetical protein
MPGLGPELHRGLKEIHVEPNTVIDSFQTPISNSGSIAVIAYQPPYYIPILLLHMATIILFVGTRSGKGNPFQAAVGIEAFIDEFAAIVRIHTEERKGKTLSHPVYCGAYPHLPLTPNWNAFRPATGNIHRAESVQIKTFGVLSTVSHQVYFQKARFVFLPVCERPYRY